MRKRNSTPLAIGGALVALLAFAQSADRSVAVAGYPTGKYLVEILLPGAGWNAMDRIDQPLAVSEYPKYSAVVWNDLIKDPASLGEAVHWDAENNLELLVKYVESGGVILVAGLGIPVSSSKRLRKLGPTLEVFVGISGLAVPRPKGSVRITELGHPLFAGLDIGRGSYEWVGETSAAAALSTTAKVLAVVSTERGEELPFITVRELGRGKVYWMGTAPARIRKANVPGVDQQAYDRVWLNALGTPPG
jgi:uncharacterized membrane protein